MPLSNVEMYNNLNDGNPPTCPYCGSDDVQFEETTNHGANLNEFHTCCNCSTTFYLVYTFKSFHKEKP